MTEKRRTLHTALAALSLVALGAVGGVTVDRLMHRPVPPSGVVVVEGDTIRLSDVHKDPVGVIDRTVGLRPDQRQKVTAILAQHQRNLDALWSDSRQRLQASVDSVMQEIAAVLDPAQASKFREVANQLHGTPPHAIRIHR